LTIAPRLTNDAHVLSILVRTGKGATFGGPADVDLDLPDLAALPGALTE